jgi:Flp pilus assembly protein TadG
MRERLISLPPAVHRDSPRRWGRGSAIVYTAAALVVLIGFASLAVDVGRVHLSRGELQAAADAAARAACAELPNGTTAARNAAVSMAAANKWDGKAITLYPDKELTFGIWDQSKRTFTPATGTTTPNAVRVDLVRGAPLMFAQAIGVRSFQVGAHSTATVIAENHAYSIIGLDSITMSGNAFTDSYRSSSGAWSINSRSDFGAIASNGHIKLSDFVEVHGDSRCGIGKATTLSGSAKVFGVKAPMTYTLKFPSVTPPAGLTDLGDIDMSGNDTSSGPGGNYLIRSLRMRDNAKHTWTGPVNLYFVNSYRIEGNATIITYQNKPANRNMYFLPTCTDARWGGNHSCVANMYAPDTNFVVEENADLLGRILAKSIVVKDYAGMHYDRDLPPIGEAMTSQTVSQVQ